MANGLSKRIQSFRERVERKQTARAADKRAKSRDKRIKEKKQAADDRARARRIRENEPETVGEEAQASARQLRLLGSELGIEPSQVKDVISDANELIENAKEDGEGALEALDLDGDGDTDILQSFEDQTNDADAFAVAESTGAADPVPGGANGGFDPADARFDPAPVGRGAADRGMEMADRETDGEMDVASESESFEKDLLGL